MTDPTSTGRSKRSTRQTLLAARDAMSADTRALVARQIAERVNGLVDVMLPVGSVLALYAPKGSEVDTRLLDGHARSHGIRVVYPRVVDGQRVLAFHEVVPRELEVSGRFGLREPRADAPVVALGDITAFVVPGLAFDRAGGRIGWGRGYYDATLAGAPGALRIGLAFACQVVESIAREPHDAPMHYLITEVATHAVV